jgi:hypothetical protein
MNETNYTDQYVAFCQRANLPINEVPTPGTKMGMTYEIAMKELDPHLYQNLTCPKSSSLKADVRSRYEKGIMWTSDADEYEAKGFCGIASNIRQEMAAARELMIENEIKAMKERNDARDEARRTQPRKLKPIGFNDPSAVAFRRQHGISDDIGAGC